LADLVKDSPEQEHRSSTSFIALSDIQVVSNMGFTLPAKKDKSEVRPLS